MGVELITPLVLMPGVALLVLSTSVRYGRAHDELHTLSAEDCESAEHILGRATLLRRALVSFYIGIFVLAVGAVGASLAELWSSSAALLVIAATTLAALLVCYGSGCLIIESSRSLQILRTHVADMRRRA